MIGIVCVTKFVNDLISKIVWGHSFNTTSASQKCSKWSMYKKKKKKKKKSASINEFQNNK